MNKPNLDRIIEAYLPISSSTNNFDVYVIKIRKYIIPYIRRMERTNKIRWYSIMYHEIDKGINGIHLRIEPELDVDIDGFIKYMPKRFKEVCQVCLADITGLNDFDLKDQDWGHAWRILGALSEFFLCLIEGHEDEIPAAHVISYLHFLTNQMALGNKCLIFSGGYMPF